MKILHILTSNILSGAENVACYIIETMSDRNDMDMAYASRDGVIREVLKEKNIKFIPINKFNYKEVRDMIKRENPDIIHAHDIKASLIVSLACRKVPFIAHIHNNHKNASRISIRSLAYLYVAGKAKKIFFVSKSSYNDFIFHNLISGKCEILYNIVDVDKIIEKVGLDENEYDFDVVFCGRCEYPKNPERLFEICSLLAAKKKDISIALIGEGWENEFTRLEQKTRGLNLKNIVFEGYKINPFKIIANSKVMIFTSRSEGIPMAALEAMALGLPIVSTPAGGMPELIENGFNGYLTDNDNEFADYVIELVNNKIKHNEFSGNQIKKSADWNNTKQYKQRIMKTYSE